MLLSTLLLCSCATPTLIIEPAPVHGYQGIGAGDNLGMQLYLKALPTLKHQEIASVRSRT